MDVMIFSERLRKLLTQEEGSLPDGVKNRIQRLHTEMQSMSEFLWDVERKIGRKYEIIEETVLKMIHHAQVVEDDIDTFIVNVMQRRSGKALKAHQKRLHDALSAVEGDIAKIRTKMDAIYANQTAYGNCRSIHLFQANETSSTVGRGRGPIVKETHMVGRADDMEKMLDSLVEGESQLTVVSIVGMGGLGKTTLAAEAYNSVFVKNYFDCRAWVYVSSQYKQDELLEGILKSVMPLYVSKKGMVAHELGITLRNYLTNKRYIIVLDDVWSSDLWEHLLEALPDDKNGSRVLLTTRLMRTALSAGQCVRPFKPRFLTTYESWKLLHNRVFGDRMCAPELKLVGISMADKCQGLPLAIMLLGGLLSKKEKNYVMWKKVDSELFPTTHDRKWVNLEDFLLYFYTELPNYLKPCFLYFGVFLDDFEISTQHLFQLWIAEGFIHESSEVIAEEYLEELMDRGLIQAVRRRSHGKIKTCRIHDLLLNLSLFTAEKDKFLKVASEQPKCTSPIYSRRLAVHNSISKFISSNSYATQIRSFLHITSNEILLSSNEFEFICQSFKLLRVLDLGAVDCFGYLPDAIENLFHLRYLRLNAPSLKSIPSELCKLRNLYTLDMPYSHINHTPHDIWKMQNLRHLYCRFIRLPGGPDCYSLRDLNFISNLCPSSCTQDVLGRLPNLRTLRICGDLSSHCKALSNNLSELHCLESLKLVGDANLSPSSSMVLSEFRFPPSLTQLTLWNTKLWNDPMPTLEKLLNLQVLKLKRDSYWGRKLACSSGGFRCLQVLHLKSIRLLEEWTVGTGAMSRLVCLVINPCAYLRKLPEELWHVKSFSKLELWWPRPELKPRLREIEDMDRYDVQIYPSGL